MSNHALLGPWVRRFLLEHISERNLSSHTQASYRDTFALLIPFVADTTRKPVDQLCVVQFSAAVVRQFLQHLEDARSCTIATRNQRLAAIHAWAFLWDAIVRSTWNGVERFGPFRSRNPPSR
jgi:integrase/recombinase XerD